MVDFPVSLDALLTASCSVTQFFTDFSSSTGWASVSNDVGGVAVTGGQLTGWGSDGGITREIFYDLVVNNGITISDTNWTAEFDFQYNVPPTSTNPGHSPFTLSDSTATTDSFQTAGPATPSVPHPRSISMVVGNFNAFNVDRAVQILVKDTTTSATSSAGGTLLSGFIDLDAFNNITVYPRLERTGATTYRLSVFTDSARTIHVTGTASGADSPVTLTASQVITSTNFIHSSNNSAGGAGRVLGGFIDNLSITSGDCSTFSIDALIKQANGQCGVDLTDLNVYYSFDEASGNLINRATAIGSVDAIPNTDGTVGGSVTRSITGQVSDGMESNGDIPSQGANRISLFSSNISDFDFMINDGEVYTVNLWIKTNVTAAVQGFGEMLVNQNNTGGSRGFMFALTGDLAADGLNTWIIRPREGGDIFSLAVRPDSSNGGSFPSFEWHMLTAVADIDSRTVDYYLDGRFIVQAGAGGASPPFTGSGNTQMQLNSITITQAGRSVLAKIDEYSIWRRGLSTFEIEQLYALNSGGTPLQDYNGGATCFTVDAIFKSLGVNGCTSLFQEDFSTSVGWVQTGSNVTISGGTLNGWGPDGSPQSQTYDLQTNNGITLNDQKWIAEFKFRYTAFGTSTGHFILSLADSSSDMGTGSIPHAGFNIRKQVGPDPIVNGLLQIDDGVTAFESTGIGLEAFVSTDLFVRLERISPTQFKLSIATDFAQTSQLPGSPTTLTEASFSNITGLDHIQSRVATGGSPARNITGTIDNLVIDAGCPTLQVDSCLLAVGTQETFSVDSIVADISSQLDLTWQYREHQTNATFPPSMTWIFGGGRLRMFTNFSSVGVAYTLKTFRLSEITGSDIKVTWERTLGNSGQGQVRVYDGTINAESLVDIPNLAGIPNTLLGQVLHSAFFGLHTDTLLAEDIDYAGATGDFITVVIRNNDGNTSSEMALFINELQVGTRVWDFTGGLISNYGYKRYSTNWIT